MRRLWANLKRDLRVHARDDRGQTVLIVAAVLMGVALTAAAVFLNWYASQPGQLVYAQVWKIPSRRIDVQVAGIPDYVVPKKGVAYLDQYTEQWYLERYLGQYQNALVEALGGR